ncbi:MAG TPA: glycosyltransferase family 4 protein [Chloroflexi bacterium]|nr:glycosyltransferase family 4 protein [Chloroflexota bacterium]
MRIVMFSNNYLPVISGVGTSITLLRRGLLEAGHEVHLVVPEYDDFVDEEPYIFRMPALDLGDQLRVSLAIPLRAPIEVTMRGIKPHLIHCHHPIWLGEVAATFSRDLQVPLVFTFHTRYDEYAEQYVPLLPDLAHTVMREIVERYLERCTHVIAPTESIRDFIRQEYEVEAPITVLPTPVDLAAYQDLAPAPVRAKWGLEEAEVLLYVGRLAGEKNLDFLLRAFARIAEERPGARLLLVGDGPAKGKLRKLAQKLDIESDVTFTGAVPHEKVPDYAAAADLFVFASVTETQGLVLTEAMAAGTPVVAVEAPGSIDILTQGGGVLVEPQEQAFSEAVLGLLSDEERLKAKGEEAFQIAQRYSVSAIAERLLAVYEAALETGPRW